MMHPTMFGGMGMMWGMVIIWILIAVALVLAVAALIKYLRREWRLPSRYVPGPLPRSGRCGGADWSDGCALAMMMKRPFVNAPVEPSASRAKEQTRSSP